MSGVSSTAAAAPNSESATSNFIVLRARGRRCVADTHAKASNRSNGANGEAFNPNRMDAVLFYRVFGLLLLGYRTEGTAPLGVP